MGGGVGQKNGAARLDCAAWRLGIDPFIER